MRPVAKAQIYSVNENLPADQVAKAQIYLISFEASLINSKELAEKENSEVADYESKLQKNCKGLFDWCVSVFQTP